ncbi:MAG: AAA family ATPase [Nannocystaceae bacterium]|nr:AAA family ATPase [Nannocystaceae bacterium]
MRITSCQFIHFMGLQKLELRLDYPMVVVVADNGVGKSSVLKGLRVAIGAYLRGIDDPDVRAPGIKAYMHRREFHRQGFDLVRRYTGPTTIQAEGRLGKVAVSWKRTLGLKRDARTTWKNTNRLNKAVKKSTGPLPLLAFYGVRSRFPNGPVVAGREPPSTRESAYADALEGPIDFQERFGRWRRLKTQASERIDANSALQELESRLASLLPGVDKVWFDADHDGPVVRFSGDVSSGGMRAFDDLSDGFQNVLAIGLDLALRSLQLNPDLGAAVFDEIEGVVLIDEVAQHLHPAWQLEVVGGLRAMFPCVQFIVSTHSPLVALGAPDDAVILRLEARDRTVVAEYHSPRDLGPTVEAVLRGPAFDLSTTWAPALERLLERRVALAADTNSDAQALQENAEDLEGWLKSIPPQPVAAAAPVSLSPAERSALRKRMAARLMGDEG